MYMLGDDFSISDGEIKKVACLATFSNFWEAQNLYGCRPNSRKHIIPVEYMQKKDLQIGALSMVRFYP